MKHSHSTNRTWPEELWSSARKETFRRLGKLTTWEWLGLAYWLLVGWWLFLLLTKN